MQSSYWGYWLVVMGVAIVGLMISVQGITTNTTQDRYAIREITDAAMLEAVDYGYYRDYNEIKINKEKFMEVFLRMTAEVMGVNDTYEVNFYAIYEAPPKVSVEIKSNSGTNFISAGDYDSTTRIDAIIQIHAENYKRESNSESSDNSENNTAGGTGSTEGDPGPVGGSGDIGNTGGDSGSAGGSGDIGNTGGDSGSAGGSGDIGNTGGESEAEVACKSGITSTSLNGMRGVAMISKPLYTTSERTETSLNVTPGVKFDILGENGRYWAIDYEGECGWVDSDYMAINLKDYIPSIAYAITNASSSMYKTYNGTSEVNIPNLTGQRLYSSEFNDFVPATYSFAQKLRIAQANAQANGDSLKIYDAYRPLAVTQYASNQLSSLRASNSQVRYYTNYSIGANTGTEYYWHESWFLAQRLSYHNTACAVDITLVGKESQMPTAMHQLSTEAIKYYASNVAHTTANYSGGMLNSAAARQLSSYMMNGTGLTDLASEWWHYQDNACHSRIGSGASFWSNV